MILDRFSLEGKSGLVTGAGSGIGKAIATGLAEAGARVALAGRNMSKLEKVEAEMKKSDLNGVPFQVDMIDPDSISNLVKSVQKEFGKIDFLFNNAGMIYRAPSEEFPLDEWEMMVKTNLTGPFLLSQAVARHMIEMKIRGSIINTSSLIAVFGGVRVPAYAATKGGLTQLTKSMCNDLAKYGIRVNAIGPGWVKTDMTQALRNDPEHYEAISARIGPVGGT